MTKKQVERLTGYEIRPVGFKPDKKAIAVELKNRVPLANPKFGECRLVISSGDSL